jgi:thiosulfate dehydrogenase [quinone] large subunit
MAGFARASPLGELIKLVLPAAGLLGLLIAIAEIAVGLGALTGLAFRVAAAGGALLSLLFFLTVSWTTHPYYLGSDLPYAVGWLTLAIAGHGGLLVPQSLVTPVDERVRRPDGRRRGTEAASPERRALLQAGLLALVAVAVSSIAVPMRILGLEHGSATAPPGSAGSAPPSTGPTGSNGSAPPLTGLAVARVADVDQSGSASFTIPFDAPAPLPAGDPGIIVRLADGSYVAYDATCTHAGCPVEWSPADAQLVCPCHGAAFDPAHAGAVLIGPARLPLASLPIVVDPGTGSILLRT